MVYLFSKEESNALGHLIVTERSDGQEEEQPVQHWRRNVRQQRQDQQTQANHNMRENGRQPRLSHPDDSEIRTEKVT